MVKIAATAADVGDKATLVLTPTLSHTSFEPGASQGRTSSTTAVHS